jgi:hypothetical protein
MKRILLSLLMVVMCTYAFAQQAVVSKAAFQAKVAQFNSAVAAHNADQAKNIMKDLNTDMIGVLAQTKAEIQGAGTQAEKDALFTKNRHQTTDYSHAMNLSNDNVLGHGAEIKDALDSFAASMH